MTKAEFSKYCEDTIRDLYSMAHEITPDLEGLDLHICINNEYESFSVDTFHFPEGEIDFLLRGTHFISKLENGGEVHKEAIE